MWREREDVSGFRSTRPCGLACRQPPVAIGLPPFPRLERGAIYNPALAKLEPLEVSVFGMEISRTGRGALGGSRFDVRPFQGPLHSEF